LPMVAKTISLRLWRNAEILQLIQLAVRLEAYASPTTRGICAAVGERSARNWAARQVFQLPCGSMLRVRNARSWRARRWQDRPGHGMGVKLAKTPEWCTYRWQRQGLVGVVAGAPVAGPKGARHRTCGNSLPSPKMPTWPCRHHFAAPDITDWRLW